MLKSFLIILLFVVPFALPIGTATPTSHDTQETFSVLPTIDIASADSLDAPVHIRATSIGLDAPIQNMGLTAAGEMDVPNGRTNNVGWYKDGTVPGDMGSAVLDAHVFAAFSKLKYLKVGSDIEIDMQSGKTLRFIVQDSRVYRLSQVPADILFNRNDAKRLNLITCAGTFIPARHTYDHRLIVYATLVE